MKVKSLFLKCLVLAAFVFGLIAVAQSCNKKDSDLYDITNNGGASENYVIIDDTFTPDFPIP